MHTCIFKEYTLYIQVGKHWGFNCASSSEGLLLVHDAQKEMGNSIRIGQKSQDWHLTRRPPKDCLGLAILDLRHRLSDHQGGRQAGPLTLRPAPMDHPSGVQNNATECSQRGGYSRWVETACPACPQLPAALGTTPRPEHMFVCAPFKTRKNQNASTSKDTFRSSGFGCS